MDFSLFYIYTDLFEKLQDHKKYTPEKAAENRITENKQYLISLNLNTILCFIN